MLVTVLCGTVTVASAEANDVELALDLTQEGDEVVAIVSVTKNDGVIDLYLRVEYDVDSLELTSRTFGKGLAALGPVDNFEEGGYEYPYRVTYVGSGKNVDETGVLFTLRFKVKEGAPDGKSSVRLVVRQVGYLVGDLPGDPVYNEKYGEPMAVTVDVESTKTGGVVVADRSVTISKGEVQKVEKSPSEKDGKTALFMGLIIGGAVLLVAGVVIAYIVDRRKRNNSDQ